MGRVRYVTCIVVAALLVLVMVAFTYDTFSLNSFLHPVPHTPPISPLNAPCTFVTEKFSLRLKHTKHSGMTVSHYTLFSCNRSTLGL